ncbi:MAG: hypothetical protein HUU55_04485, partial [Myxococcales bacterium]|nr:hypothetical protein [Myxococcales bacterium]
MQKRKLPLLRIVVLLGTAGLCHTGCGDTEINETNVGEELTDDDVQETSAAIFAGASQCKVTAVKAAGCYPEKKWYTFAEGKCSGKGLTLSKFAPIGACETGLVGIEFVCCPSSANESGTGDTQPDAPANTPKPIAEQDCSVHSAGGPNVCHSEEMWKKQTSLACAEQGLLFGKIKLGGECKGGFSYAKFTCCAGAPPPPTTQPACAEHKVDINACKDAAAWKESLTKMCLEKGQNLAKFEPLAQCASGGFSGAIFVCCSSDIAPPPPPPPPTGSCVENKFALDSCKNESELKEIAYKECLQLGLALADLNLYGPCSSGGFSIAAYVCCGNVDQPQPPPPPPGECVEHKLTLNTCKNEGELKEIAYKDCLQLGLSLADLNLYGPCASGGFSTAAYICCGETQPPQPDPTDPCFEAKMGGADSCKPAEIWKEYATKACAEQGFDLVKFTTAEPCADGTGFHLSYYACCAASVPPPPQPPPDDSDPQACFEGKMGEPTSCKPPEVWKEYAAKMCLQANAELTALEVAVPCSNTGGYAMAYYVCCSTPGATDPPQPTPTTDCTEEGKLGSPTSCKSEETWLEYAAKE